MKRIFYIVGIYEHVRQSVCIFTITKRGEEEPSYKTVIHSVGNTTEYGRIFDV